MYIDERRSKLEQDARAKTYFTFIKVSCAKLKLTKNQYTRIASGFLFFTES